MLDMKRFNKSVIKIICVISILSCIPKSGFSQKFIIGYGLSFYTDVVIASAEDDQLNTGSSTAFSLISVSAEMKYNVKEFNSDMALSVATSPGIGLMTSLYGSDGKIGNLKVPVYLQLDFGNLSTFESMKDRGFGIGLGIEYHMLGLFGAGSSEFAKDISPVITPAARLGYRYYNRNNSARELALKFGMPATTEVEFGFYNDATSNYETRTEDIKITSVQFSWIFYFNY